MNVMFEYHSRMSCNPGEVYTASLIVFCLRSARYLRVQATDDWDKYVKKIKARVIKRISD